MYFHNVMAKSVFFGLCHFPGNVALDIIGLIDITMLQITLKGYLPNSIFLLRRLLSIVGENYRALINVVH